MKYVCAICEKESQDIQGHEVWARECGFYELLRLGHGGCLSGYVVCSKRCGVDLLSKLMGDVAEVEPAGSPSRTWKCEQCGKVLPRHMYQDKEAKDETVPSCTQLVYPNEWGKYHCFCSDACLMANMMESEIVTKTA